MDTLENAHGLKPKSANQYDASSRDESVEKTSAKKNPNYQSEWLYTFLSFSSSSLLPNLETTKPF